jgi:hypothetical protein
MNELQGNVICVIVLCCVLGLVGTYDVYASLFLGRTATVSVTVLSLSREHPVLPFLAGVLVGHLLWPQV